MKLAKATTEDRDAAMCINGILNDMEAGQFPRDIDGDFKQEDPDFFDEVDEEHCKTAIKRLLRLMRRRPGGMNRVIWGHDLAMTNDVFDPDADTYEWHPFLMAAVAARKDTTASPEEHLPHEDHP